MVGSYSKLVTIIMYFVTVVISQPLLHTMCVKKWLPTMISPSGALNGTQ